MRERFDIVVVGAGSAGGVAAARLSEDPDRRVLLLEAGPDFPDEAETSPLFAVSGEHSWRVSGVPEFDWGFTNTDAAGTLGGRTVRLPRGRLVGGSSMVNSTIAARPAPFDLDRWAALGNPGWAWNDLLPYFRHIERDLDFGHEPIHGADGPIVVRRYRPESWAPVNAAFIDACLALGVSEHPDLNGLDAHAGVCGRMPHNRYKEVRQGTLVTYLRAARGRANLVIHAGRLVDRVLIDHGRAVGVRYLDSGGAAREIAADRVVLSAGVYGTPCILQRSGIGRPDHLRRLGIEPIADLPAVGEGLVDHPGCAFWFRAEGLAGMTGRLFATNWRGPAEAGPVPAWQTHPMPIDEEEGICGLWIYITRQDSRGSVAITSADPRERPLIDHRYLTDPRDLGRFARGFEAAHALLATPPFARVCARWLDADRPLAERLRDGLASAHHQSGTCRMGPAPDGAAVVGPDLGVHGIEGLMIADTSVFPDTVMHNTNLAALVVGEVAADLIRGRRPAHPGAPAPSA